MVTNLFRMKSPITKKQDTDKLQYSIIKPLSVTTWFCLVIGKLVLGHCLIIVSCILVIYVAGMNAKKLLR